MSERVVSELRFRLNFIVEQDKVTLRQFLKEQNISKRTLVATKYDNGKLSVNGVECDVRSILKKGDLVEIIFPSEEISAGLVVETGELKIIYEDEAILIIDKPHGQSTLPSQNHQSGTLANFVAGKFVLEKIPATVHLVLIENTLQLWKVMLK